MLIAVLVDGQALDVFHHQERHAVVGHAAVVEPGDVGVLERGQDLPLVAQTAQAFGTRPPLPDELERHLLLELSVGPFGEVDRAHAALTDLAKQAVGADAPSGLLYRRLFSYDP